MKESLITWINPEKIHHVGQLNEQALAGNEVIVIAIPAAWHIVEKEHILEHLKYTNAIHAGLCFGGHKMFEELMAVSLNWNFLSPCKNISNFSWKATEHFVAFRKHTFVALGGFDTSFTPTASVAEFCYRIMKSGGLVRYIPLTIKQSPITQSPKVANRDVLLFAARHLSIKHATFLKFYYFLILRPVFASVNNAEPKQNAIILSDILSDKPLKSVKEYTAIIPTILRYDYIFRSIESLKKSEFPPKEIIVVDQTPAELRKPELYEPYIKEGILRVFYLDEPGQSTARNLAIREARTEWLLFFEDDTEAWPGMMEAHKYLLEYSLADVSTGVSLAPWKDESYIPERNRKYHVSDVLATGNCFMRKETALSVDGLHPAFDKGPGADDDFGRRLFLSGKLIVFNPKAIQTHHKAPKGGMRTHGVWWRNTSGKLDAFPPPTQAFVIRKYYPVKYRALQLLLFYFRSKDNTSWSLILNTLLFPIKFFKSLRLSSVYLRKFPA